MIHGVLNVYKEKGYTSHDVVAKLRGIVKQKKIGHTGTLDPDAEGVLPVCFGKATKLCDLLTDKDKTYQAVLLLGQVTDTQDTSGQVLEKHSTEDLTNEKVENVIRSFEGEYDQIPPMYSALKVNGKKLYELAREGKEVERKARRITIHEIRILEINLPEVKLEVTCSKGTYIRTLCHDIGQKLGCGGCMKELLRTRVERFGLEDSIRLGEIAQLQKENVQKDIRAYAAEKGLTGEQAESVLAGFQTDLEAAKKAIDSIAQIISDKETAAATAKEQELLKGTPNPGGGTGGNPGDDKPEDVKNAESISFGNKADEQSMKDYYVLK